MDFSFEHEQFQQQPVIVHIFQSIESCFASGSSTSSTSTHLPIPRKNHIPMSMIRIALWLTAAIVCASAPLTSSMGIINRSNRWSHHLELVYHPPQDADATDYENTSALDYNSSSDNVIKEAKTNGSFKLNITVGNGNANVSNSASPIVAFDSVRSGGDVNSADDVVVTMCTSGTYLPSAKDCSTFLACQQGELTEVQCPTDMWFDPRHQENVLCNHPQVVCAADSSVCECMTQYPPLPPDPLIEPGVTCLVDNRFHFTASQLECSRYFVCLNDIVKRLECRPGLQYNPETELCDYPELVNCQVLLVSI